MWNKIVAPFTFHRGNSPLLVSIPHTGTGLLPAMPERLTDEARRLPDTDWHLTELYAFLAELDVSVISANYSRYVVDLNRALDDAPLYSGKTTGLFPQILFADSPVFRPGKQFTDQEERQIIDEVWQPYHQKLSDELARIKAQFGYAILFDAHSIAARVPMLFDGTLPEFNFGSNSGEACAPALLDRLTPLMDRSRYSWVCNGRFKGGYITRCYGQPAEQVHAIQLELSQATYLADDATGYPLDSHKVQAITPLLRSLIESLRSAGNPAGLPLQG